MDDFGDHHDCDDYSFSLSEEDYSLLTSPRNSPTLSPIDIITYLDDSPSDSQRNRHLPVAPVYILPYPKRFVEAIYESATPRPKPKKQDVVLANVIHESFPLLMLPGSYDENCEKFLSYVRGKRQLFDKATTPSDVSLEHPPLMCTQELSDSVHKKTGKQKDPNKYRMKNRPIGMKYKKKLGHQKGKVSAKKSTKRLQSRTKKESLKGYDVRTSIFCLI